MTDIGVATITESWQKFIGSLRVVSGHLTDEIQAVDYFAPIREAAFDMAETEMMLDEFEAGYKSSSNIEAANVVIRELNAVSSFVATLQQSDSARETFKRVGKRLLRIGITGIGSVGDIFKMSEKGKAILKLVEEALDLTGITVELFESERLPA